MFCSPQEVEVKDHQLNNEPGGEIKEKTSRSSNCSKTANLKLQGVGPVVGTAVAKKETNMLRLKSSIIILQRFLYMESKSYLE